MKLTTPLRRVLSLLASAAFALAVAPSAAPAAETAPTQKKVLFFTKSSGFEHSVIKQFAGRPSFAMQVLKELGETHQIEFVESKDGSLFSPAYLAQFDAFFFYTSGDLLRAKNNEKLGDGHPALTPAGKAALLAAVAAGKGFIASHATTDSFHSPGNLDHGPARNQADGDKTDDFVKMLGAEFIKHDAQQKARQLVADAKFPGMSAVAADFGPHEEWYSLKNFARDLHVLLIQETKGMVGPSYARPPYPSTWARLQGKGRVFYTTMGHREDVWMNPTFQSVLMGGINWALRRTDADVAPNIARVTPHAGALPPYVAPPPPKAKAGTKQQ